MSIKINFEKLKTVAADLGLSTYQVGAVSGVPQTTVAAIFAGKVSPAAEKLKRICDVLDLDINDVFITDEVKAAA